ncbi:hypothetical protein [Gordonia phthalatica]|uniref:Scramblase n=1 Tax=Gordonia phthalatica TaxID=1136941 RepID=A0A0N9MRA8_9ACTN|nr:hypothetical protein [Gordonia phthalatica]ALG85500.1 hypothetical protein ACH46_14755 [Gordonia phthalatica]
MEVRHVRKVSIEFKRKYRLFNDDGRGRPGAVTGYAEKQLTASDEFTLYRDDTRTEQLAVVKESSAGFLASLTGYEVFTPGGGGLGTFGVVTSRSMQRTTWQFDQPGLGQLTGTERSLATARSRRVIALLGDVAGEVVNSVMKYHFDFADIDGTIVFSVEKPKVFDDWYRLVLHDDSVDPLLVSALAITMEARSR